MLLTFQCPCFLVEVLASFSAPRSCPLLVWFPLGQVLDFSEGLFRDAWHRTVLDLLLSALGTPLLGNVSMTTSGMWFMGRGAVISTFCSIKRSWGVPRITSRISFATTLFVAVTTSTCSEDSESADHVSRFHPRDMSAEVVVPANAVPFAANTLEQRLPTAEVARTTHARRTLWFDVCSLAVCAVLSRLGARKL